MTTLKIIELMNSEEHCPDCGAILVPLPLGTLCPHCGLENDEPEAAVVLAFGLTSSRLARPFRPGLGQPTESFEEVA